MIFAAGYVPVRSTIAIIAAVVEPAVRRRRLRLLVAVVAVMAVPAGTLFGFPETMPVTTWVPVFLFVLLFGLSMDYEVFLLSQYPRGVRPPPVTTRSRSAAGWRSVHGAGDLGRGSDHGGGVPHLRPHLGAVSVKQIGLGLAAAVLIDATVVLDGPRARPSLELLGHANWWLPRRYGRSVPPSEQLAQRPAEQVGRASPVWLCQTRLLRCRRGHEPSSAGLATSGAGGVKRRNRVRARSLSSSAAQASRPTVTRRRSPDG